METYQTQVTKEKHQMILNIVKLNKELSTLRTEKQESATQLAALKLEKDKYDEAKAKYEEEKGKLEEKLKKMEEDMEELKGRLEETKKEEAAVVVAVTESVDQKVVQKLAAIGVAEGTVKEEVAAVVEDPQAIYATFESLQGKDKIDFFKKNERSILKAMRVIHYRPIDVVKANMKTV
jgi:chromosome segregation ATPase